MPDIKNIYLSEDDADDRLFFKSAFHEICDEHILTIFENNTELLSKLSDTTSPPPDLLFMDLNMPGVNGIECLKELRELPHLKHIPVVIYSTISTDLFVEEVYALEATRFITKPYDYYELVNIIKHIVDLNLEPKPGKVPFDEFVLSYDSIKKPL